MKITRSDSRFFVNRRAWKSVREWQSFLFFQIKRIYYFQLSNNKKSILSFGNLVIEDRFYVYYYYYIRISTFSKRSNSPLRISSSRYIQIVRINDIFFILISNIYGFYINLFRLFLRFYAGAKNVVILTL